MSRRAVVSLAGLIALITEVSGGSSPSLLDNGIAGKNSLVIFLLFSPSTFFYPTEWAFRPARSGLHGRPLEADFQDSPALHRQDICQGNGRQGSLFC